MSAASPSSSAAVDRDVLLILTRREGFFSLVFQVLGLAHLAERHGLTPLVYFNRQCPYWSDQGHEGARNVWEYFFEPLSSLQVEDLFTARLETIEQATREEFTELAQGTRVKVTNTYPDVVEYWSPLGVESERGFVHGLITKFMRLKPGIRGKVDAFCRSAGFGAEPVIGVQYRGAEKARGTGYDGVVVKPPVDLKRAFLEEMRLQTARRPGTRFFLATDSKAFLDEAKAAFGDAVLFREAKRLDAKAENVGLHFSAEAHKNGAALAEEVLLDTLLLARTDFLIHGISNVSNAVLYMNPRLEHADIELRTTRGTVYLKRELFRRVDKALPGPVRLVKTLLGRAPVQPW
jgi:hypothetical protein